MFNQTEPQISEASNHLKHLTESEILDVLECARKVSARDHALILVTYIYGLRNQEVVRLRPAKKIPNNQNRRDNLCDGCRTDSFRAHSCFGLEHRLVRKSSVRFP